MNTTEKRKKSWSGSHTTSLSAKSMFFYVQSLGCLYSNPDYFTDRSNYNTILLVYTLGGKGYLKYRNNNYTLKKNDIFLIDCIDHQYYTTDTNDLWKLEWIHFNGIQSRDYIELIYKNSGPVLSLDKETIVPVKIRKIHQLYKSGDIRFDIISSCCIAEILTELLLQSCHGRPDSEYMPETVQKAVSFIEKNCSSPIKLDTISKHACISKYYLSRQFKKYTGYSPHEYIIKQRLSHSKNLLKNSELPVYEIASKSGFQSASHFIKTFSRYENQTPLKFRNYWK